MRLDGKKVLVTGGAGFIGSHLVDQLTNCAVRVLDNFSTGKESNLACSTNRSNVEIIRGDICDRSLVAELVQDTNVIFHLACRGVRHSIGNPIESHEVNATGSLYLLTSARRAGVERFIHVSSSEVYGTARYAPMDEYHHCSPETVYGAAKLAGEAYARAHFRTYDLPVVIVRPFNNFGPRSHFEGDSGEVIPRFCIWALDAKRPIIFGDGLQTRDFLYVEETAYWLTRIAECDELVGQTVNLGSGNETSMCELAKIVYEEAGLPGILPVHRAPRPGDVRRLIADAAVARCMLDFMPRTTLRQGIRKLLEHLRSQNQSPAELMQQIQDENWNLTITN